MQNKPLWKTIWQFFYETKHNPAILLLDIYPHELKTCNHTKICTPMFTAALFITARTWKQPRCSSKGEWINKLQVYCIIYCMDIIYNVYVVYYILHGYNHYIMIIYRIIISQWQRKMSCQAMKIYGGILNVIKWKNTGSNRKRLHTVFPQIYFGKGKNMKTGKRSVWQGFREGTEGRIGEAQILRKWNASGGHYNSGDTSLSICRVLQDVRHK